MSNTWNKIKKSGHYHRSLTNRRKSMLRRAYELERQLKNINPDTPNVAHFSVAENPHQTPSYALVSEEPCCSKADVAFETEADEIQKNQILKLNLRKWATEFHINHSALRNLIEIVNKRLYNGTQVLPTDPRTFMQTPRTVNIIRFNDGEYWHNGMENCLKDIFSNVSEPTTISININMDGLPLFRSSKVELWPILFKVSEMPAKIIGIFCGKSKCNNLHSFLSPFVDELYEIMNNGIIINSIKISVLIRCFICDSPARAFIKGVAYFNSHHGCLKCTTLGEYSHISHTNIFPRTLCEKRTDEKFRLNSYGSHHKAISPLLKLNVDMVEQFPVGDELHLLHLGIMKRLLFGWRDGTFRNSGMKWRANTTTELSEYLNQCKMPAEFHRVVRGLECLTHWKGTEYRTFLHYVGIIVLKDHLTFEAYNHFMLLFCAVTICSSKQYFSMLPMAHQMIITYIEIFAEIYGEQYMTSNVHNLVHLVDEVQRFGELSSFSAYPFESMLGKIKRLLRNGNQPLAQIAKRILEDQHCSASLNDHHQKKTESYNLSQRNDGVNVPHSLKATHVDIIFFNKIQLADFCLCSDSKNCWFLSKENEIACVINILLLKDKSIRLSCDVLEEKEFLFMLPIVSSALNIYCSKRNTQRKNKLMNLQDVKFKLVCQFREEMLVFIPLLHTNT